MKVSLLYFDGCPNWTVAYERLAAALVRSERSDVIIELVRIESEEQAIEADFAGSPTLLIDGDDPFPGDAPRTGLSCRLYATPHGLDGSPTVEQLISSLTRG